MNREGKPVRAITYTRYGSPSVLKMTEVEKPVPKENEVLVEVYASSVNAADLDLLRGVFFIRLAGLLKPQYKILGSDIAGKVEAIGSKVEHIQPGDEVFGDLTEFGFGAFAEYACVPEIALAKKPSGMPFDEAASVPSAGGVALRNLRGKRRIQPGQKVLINGAGGGMGTFAVQIAKSYGAEVTGVDKAGKLEIMRSIGADRVIDYTSEDFTESGEKYDMILDVAAHRSINDYKRALNPKGIYLFVGGSMAATFQAVFLGPLISKNSSKEMGILMAYPDKEDLVLLRQLIESGKVAPVIDRRYPLSGVPEALGYLETGQAQGKVVITVK